MSEVKVSKGARVKWQGMRTWSLARAAVPAAAGTAVLSTLTPRPLDAPWVHRAGEETHSKQPTSNEDSGFSGQGSGEGGRDGLRRPAPWSLAQGSGAFRSPLPAASSRPRKDSEG